MRLPPMRIASSSIAYRNSWTHTIPSLMRRSYSLADLDIDASDLAPRLRSEFECKVVQADVYNGMAWVDIDVTSKNIASAVDSFAREVAGDALSYDDEGRLSRTFERSAARFDRQAKSRARCACCSRSSRAMMGGRFRKATWNRCSVRHGVHSEIQERAAVGMVKSRSNDSHARPSARQSAPQPAKEFLEPADSFDLGDDASSAEAAAGEWLGRKAAAKSRRKNR